MARLIDANVAIERAKNSDKIVGTSIWGTGEVVEFLEDCPTVDAVEVVRCSSCQHSTLPAVLTQRYGEPGTLTCHNWKSPCNKRNVKADGFCSYGERRTDG